MDWSKADVASYWCRLGDADARRAHFTPLLASRQNVLAKMLV
jgi:hypothetical protein